MEASTGGRGLELARQNPPELIVVDLNMPGMNGYEFVRELRADPAVAGIRVLFCTATYDQDEVGRIAETLGVSHILVKPLEPEEIIRVVAEALAADGAATPSMAGEEFDREQLRVLNAKLVQKIDELETLTSEQRQLHGALVVAQRETAESLSLLEALQSTSPVGFGFVDRDFRWRRMNETLAAYNGAPIVEQLGRSVAETAPDLWSELESTYRQVLETGEPVMNVQVQGQVRSAPGVVGSWLSSYYPVVLDDRVIGVGVVVVDITDRQQAEDFRSVVMENMAEGLVVVDRDGCLTFMNASASRMTGWSEEELRGQPLHATIHHQRADGSPFPVEDCPLTTASRNGRTVRISEDAFTRKDGSIFPVAYSAAPLLSARPRAGSCSCSTIRPTSGPNAHEFNANSIRSPGSDGSATHSMTTGWCSTRSRSSRSRPAPGEVRSS